MVEFEKLVLEVESTGMSQALRSLDGLERQAGATEQALEDLTGASKQCSKASEQLGSGAAKTAAELNVQTDKARLTAAALELTTGATLAHASATEINTVATTAEAVASAALAGAVSAATAAELAHTAAELADAAATSSDTVATVANTAAVTSNIGAISASITAWLTHAGTTLKASAATAIATARQSALTAVNYAYATSARVATGATAMLNTGVAALYVKLAALAVPLVLVTQLVGATKSYQDFNAQLRVATKSSEGAAEAYSALTSFAAQTPYSLSTATASFIKLVNLGLDPGERALRSYGNTASSMGKDLNSMIEAVADASVFEFERLKEFGIKANKEGESIRFIFQGVRTDVQATSSAVEEYLTQLGENQFAGAMASRMETLGGVMSNLGDSWDKLMVTISDAGAGAVIVEAFSGALEAVEELNDVLASGQLEAHVDSYVGMWTTALNEIKQDFSAATSDIKTGTSSWGEAAETATSVMVEAFEFFPLNVKAVIDIAGTYLYRLVASGKIAAKTAVDVMVNEFERLRAHIQTINLELESWFNRSVVDMSGVIGATNKKFNEQHASILQAAEQERQTLQDITNIDDILEQRDAKIQALKDERTEADNLRQAYDLINHVRSAQDSAQGDRLSKFRVGSKAVTASEPSAVSGGGGGGSAGPDVVKQRLAEELALLEEGLLREDEKLSATYAKRRDAILENTRATEEERRALSLELLASSILTEEASIQEAYDRQRDIILSATELTETQKTELIKRATTEREEALAAIEGELMDKRLKGASGFFNNLASMGEAFGKKGFAVAKAAAIAETVVNTASAAMKAYKDGGAYLGPVFAAAAIAAGAAQVATISQTQYQGRYEHGGMISAGRYGLVGEAGPEIVKGPAIVSSAVTTAAQRRPEGSGLVVKIYNVAGQTAEVEQKRGDDGNNELHVIIRKVEENLTAKVSSGGGTLIPALTREFKLTRGN